MNVRTTLILSATLVACGDPAATLDAPEELPRGGPGNAVCVGELACPRPEPVWVLLSHGEWFRGPHLGADLGGGIGDQVTAPCSGEVVFAGDMDGYGSHHGAPGPVVLLQCADTSEPVVAVLGHCAPSVTVGATVQRGAPVCTLAPYPGPEDQDWSHLHFASRRGTYGDGGNYFLGSVGRGEKLASDGGAWVDPLTWRGSAEAGCEFEGQNPDTTQPLVVLRGETREVEIVYRVIGPTWVRPEMVLASTTVDGQIVPSFLEGIEWIDGRTVVTSLGRGATRAPDGTPAIFTFRWRVPANAPLGRVKIYFAPARRGADRALCGVGTHFWLDVRPAPTASTPPPDDPPTRRCRTVFANDFDDGQGRLHPEIHEGVQARHEIGRGLARLHIDAPAAIHEVQLVRPEVRVRTDRTYRLSFRARADRRREVVAEMSMMDDPWMPVGLHRPVALDDQWQTHTFEYRGTDSRDRARINLAVGGVRGRVDVDHIGLEVCDP